jgi:hypothetical protein
MSYGLQAPTGWWGNSGTYDVGAPGDETTAGQATKTATVNDAWGGFWDSVVKPITSYAIARDAAKSGIAVQNSGGTMPGYQGPVYTQAPAAPAPALGGLLPLLLVGAVVYVVASK